MSGARQPGQKPATRGLANIRDWTEAIAGLLKFSDILPLQQSFAITELTDKMIFN